jgi:archaellum component FlaD/FlaE
VTTDRGRWRRDERESERLDPRRYDVSELRHAAEPRPDPFVWATPQEPPVRETASPVDREALYFDLLTTACPGRPYLRSLPGNAYAELLVFDWLVSLRERTDTATALKALRFYETVEWLTPEVVDALVDRLVELDGPTDGRPLSVDDHLASLHAIALLAAASR